MGAGPGEKRLERRLLAGGHSLADRGSGSPENPIEIGGEEGGAIGVRLVEAEQLGIEPGGFDQRRIAIGDRGIDVGLPGQKLLGASQSRGSGVEFEGILRGQESPLTRSGELERIAGEHVPDRRPVGVPHRSGLDQRRPLRHRERLQNLLLRTTGLAEAAGKAAADLGQDGGEIPGRHRRQVACVGGPLGPLAKPPLVHLVEAPGPVGLDGLEHGPGFGWSRDDLRREPNDPLGILGRPITHFGEHPRGDRPGRLGPGTVGDRGRFDSGQGLESRLRLALVEGELDRLPRGGPRPRDRLVRPGKTPHRNASQKDGHQGPASSTARGVQTGHEKAPPPKGDRDRQFLAAASLRKRPNSRPRQGLVNHR